MFVYHSLTNIFCFDGSALHMRQFEILNDSNLFFLFSLNKIAPRNISSQLQFILWRLRGSHHVTNSLFFLLYESWCECHVGCNPFIYRTFRFVCKTLGGIILKNKNSTGINLTIYTGKLWIHVHKASWPQSQLLVY